MKFSILILGTNLEIGGDVLSTIGLAKQLSKREHQIFYMSRNGPLLKEFKGTNISHIENRSVGRHTPQAIVSGVFRICKFLNRNKVDIIHIQTAPSIIIAYFARLFCSKHKPVVIWHNRGVKKLTYLLGPRVFINPLVDFVISISDYEKKKLLKYGLDHRKAKTVYHGVYLAHSREVKEINIRPQYDIDSDIPLIGIIARLAPEKGHEYFIKAASEVLKRLPEVRFLVVGDGVLRPRLEKLAMSLGIEREVVFAKPRTDITNIYSAIDILVHPSSWESLCNVILEAMIMSKPIIATNCSAIPEVIEDGIDGILVPPKNSSKIADSIFYLLKNKDISKKMGQAARKKAELFFNVENQVNKIEQIYHFAIQKKRMLKSSYEGKR